MFSNNKLSLRNSHSVSICKIFSIFALLWGLNLGPESRYVHHLASRIFPNLPFTDFLVDLAFRPDVMANESLQLVSLLSSPHLCPCNCCLRHSPFLLAVQTRSVLPGPASVSSSPWKPPHPDLSGPVPPRRDHQGSWSTLSTLPTKALHIHSLEHTKAYQAPSTEQGWINHRRGEFKEVRSGPKD